MTTFNELSAVDTWLRSKLISDSSLVTLLGGINEVQRVSVGGATSGTFTLTVSPFGVAQTTAAIAFNVSAAGLQASLEALSSIGSGNVSVVKPSAGIWDVTFQGALALRNIGNMTLNSSLVGATLPKVTTTIDGGVPVYSEMAPQGVNPPYVIIQFLSSPDLNVFGSDGRAFTRPLYIVKAVTLAAGFTTAGQIADRIDVTLMGASGQLTSPQLVIQGCFREQPIRYSEVGAGGDRINHLGGQYRLFVNAY